MLINFKMKGGVPVCEQLYDNFAGNIRAGGYAPGEPMPYIRQVAKDCGINPNTVQKTYKLLEQRGYIYTIPAKGSYVCDELPDDEAEADTKVMKDKTDTPDSTGSALSVFRSAAEKAVSAGVAVSDLRQVLFDIENGA